MDNDNEFERIEYIKEMPIKCFIAGVEHTSYHWHPEIEVIFLIEGELNIIDDGVEYSMKEGDIILINSKSIHSSYSEADNLALILQFPPKVFQTEYSDTTFYFNLNSTADVSCQPKDLKKLQAILASLGREVFKKSDGFQYYINSCFYQLIGYLFRYSRYDTINKSGSKAREVDLDRIEKIIKYFELNYKDDISLSDVADGLSLSVSQLTRFFKDKMGVSCIDYLHHVRINHAKQLLNDPRHTVLFISEECGFSSVVSFYRVFRTETGMTPTEYREGNSVIKKDNDSFVQGYRIINPMAGYEALLKYEM